MEALTQLLLIPGRLRFRWKNRRRLKVTEGLKVTLKQRCEEAARVGSEPYRGLYNVGLFLALLEQDISAFNESIYFARSDWHRQFHARSLAVLLHEGAEDLSELLGKEYRNWLNEVDVHESLLSRLNLAHSKLSAFRKNHGRFLSDVRNYIGAHREHDALAQVDMMSRFTALDVYCLAAEFTIPLRDLVDLYMELLAHMHQPMNMLKAVMKAQQNTP
ncbi:hypothetical protein [Rhodoferax sp. BAB1]|uniref:hypothetical protein n=1 Tax=Rhodoferax sp. BAB1 TaxID=2741720 RepID=UPI001576CAE6|nr:hypothetical protein [Rhodoferax sp. BAB1]QKO20654.1 hypothetical protein HTY51_01510 [Rhodoferax sp. BAB1]